MGVVIITTLAFGLITPPYGLCLLMASKFVGVQFLPGDARLVPDLRHLLRAPSPSRIFFPEVVLWLPKQLLPQSVGCFANPSGSGYICP